ncbi:MAG: leucine zipper domain-containing protein, partial [Bacilli bacterium]
MNILTQQRNYLPIDLETRYNCCLRKENSGWDTKKILSYYHVRRSSLYRWLSRFDGSKDSLADRSHRPLSVHPRKTNGEVEKKILNLHKRNPTFSHIEIWTKLKHGGVELSG